MKDVPLNLTDSDLFSVLLDRHKKQNSPKTNPKILTILSQIALKIVSTLKSARHTVNGNGD